MKAMKTKQKELLAKHGITEGLIDLMMNQIQDAGDLFGPEGALQQLKGALMQRMLEAEMQAHLGYDKHEQAADGQSNRRNGTTQKTVQTESGSTRVTIPRDRDGSFEPALIPKHRRRLEGFDQAVCCLYTAAE